MVDTKTTLLPLVLRMIFAAIALRIDRARAHDTRAGMKCVTIDNVTVQVQLWNASTLKIGKSSVKGHTRISN